MDMNASFANALLILVSYTVWLEFNVKLRQSCDIDDIDDIGDKLLKIH